MEKSEELMRLDFEYKPTYGYDYKYIKRQTKTYSDSIITNFHNKKCQEKKYHVNVYQ